MLQGGKKKQEILGECCNYLQLMVMLNGNTIILNNAKTFQKPSIMVSVIFNPSSGLQIHLHLFFSNLEASSWRHTMKCLLNLAFSIFLPGLNCKHYIGEL